MAELICTVARAPARRRTIVAENACPACQSRLEHFDSAGDDLLDQLTHLRVGANGEPGDDARQNGDDRWRQAVLAIASESTRGAGHVSADAGRDLARRLLEGP